MAQNGFAQAVSEAQERAQLGHSRHRNQLRALDAELAKSTPGSTTICGLSRPRPVGGPISDGGLAAT
jgi:hypothetical protein